MNIAFLINAVSANSEGTFSLMKNTIKAIVTEYGTSKVQYFIIVYGDVVRAAIGSLGKTPDVYNQLIGTISPASGGSRMDSGLEEAKKVFDKNVTRPNATNVVVVLTDSRSTGDDINTKKMKAGKDLDNMGIKIILVGIGQAADKTELEAVAPYKENIILTPSNTNPLQLANQIMGTMFKGLFKVFFSCLTPQSILKL